MIRNNKISKKNKFLNLRFFLLFSFLIALIISILDSLINYWFFSNDELGDIIIPSVYSHGFYQKIMIIGTFVIFGIILYYFLRKRFSDQQSIIDSELRFKTVANYTKDWEYWISPNKKINFISPSCRIITGFAEHEFYDQPELIDEIIYEEDKKLFIEHETEALLGNDVDPLEFRIVTKDNQIIWIDHSCQSVYDFKGKYIGHRVSNRNITSRKRVEEKLKETTRKLKENNKLLKREVDLSYLELEAIISQSPYAKAIFDKNGDTISVNDAWHKLFLKKETIKNILDLSNLPNEYLRENVERVLNEGGAFKSDPIYFEQLDKMLQLAVYEIKNLNDETEKIVCNYEDVTDQIERLDFDRELELQRTVSKKLFQFLEDERKHISKDLHDQIGQKLMLIKLNTEMLKESAPEIKDKADEIIKLLLSTTKEIKDIIYSLHPAELENYGLVAALDSMINICGDTSNFKVSINVFGNYSPLEKNKELAIYRICQEVVSNIAKHSKATEANFKFHFEEDKFIGIINDNGIGFNIQEFRMTTNAPRSFGLISIQERAKNLNGTLEFESKIGEGTNIYFQIPLKEEFNA
ncbi:MAG: histidine kinase [Melioribacteraceae bacterium]|nr:histidine kinase [Melioribacteraceae bacterium]